ncbi:dNA (Cytosine-5-)-methyltransferase [Firmicutes bacterium CAG:552]|nr:dNA (Cytosine-5-)-methyltransferase [Firmicutes bacterium CAG:552]
MPNLSQIKRKRMLEFLGKIKKEHKNDDEMLIALGEIESELNAKKYGLVWEEHEEKVDVQMRTNIPVFTELKEREISVAPDKPYNFLLEGDNLHSLYLLEKTHKGAIDLIYIDPPYNTGNKDFIYDDKIIDTNDSFRHSKWLSFLDKRLRIAQTLLSEHGAIFISIDDNEIAQLKLVCDDIFGEMNCLGIIIQNKLNAKNDTIDIQKNHEYILVYRKKENYISGTKTQPTLIRIEKKFKTVYQEGTEFYFINDSITTRGEGGTLNARPNLGYTVYYNKQTQDIIAVADYDIEKARISNSENDIYTHDKSLIEKGYFPIIPPRVRGKLGCWTWALDKFNSDKKQIIITGKEPNYSVKKRTFVRKDNIENIDGKLVYVSVEEENSRSIVDFSTNEGTNELTDIMGRNSSFNNPKNLDLIKYLLSLVPNKNSVVLDFFAGSGTTAQAVIELNKEDGGNRRFILCTNNENEICDNVTYPRIKTVISGKRADGSTYSDGLPANLKYYRTDFVSRDEEFLSDALLEHIAEMIQLEHGVKIDGSQYLMVMSDKEADELQKHFGEYSGVIALYVSKNVLLTTQQLKTFEGVEIHIIPDNYFKFELKEEGQAW